MLPKRPSLPPLAYLLKKFPRLSETFVLNEILAQERLGRAIHVFSRRAPDDEPRHRELGELRAAVEVLPTSREVDPWALVFGEADPLELFARIDRAVTMARSWNHPRLSSLINEALYLLKRSRELEIPHIHTHFATDSAMVAMLVRELGGPNYSLTVHAKDIYRDTVNESVLRRLLMNAEFVVTVCDANVRYLRETLGAEATANVRRLYNGVELSSFSDPSVPFVNVARDPAHVLSIGRLVEKKGFDILLKALAVLHQRGRTFTATLVGEGEGRVELQRLIAELGLSDQVHLAGVLNQDQVRTLLRRATVFCLPCVVGQDGNRDALPTVLLECLASGLPCVSTPVSGIPEILDEGRAGVLVPTGDVEETAEAIEKLLLHPRRREELASAGSQRAVEHFDLRRSSETLFGWFDEVLRAYSMVGRW